MKPRALVCALLLAFAASNAAAASYNFDYTTDGGQVMGIDRVFDDGQNTVVAFYGPLGYERPTITSEAGTVLPYRVVDRYLVVPGIHRRVMIYARGVAAQVVYGRAPALQLPAAGFASPAAAFPAAMSATPLRPQAAEPVVALPPDPDPAPVPARPATSAAGQVFQTAAGHTVRVGVPVSDLPAAPAVAAKATVAAAAAAPANDRFVVSDEEAPPPPPRWTAAPGASLRITTEQWARKAGWTVYWNLKNGADYETLALRADGEFLSALRQLYAPYLQADGERPVRVAAYPRQNIIVISE